MAAPSVKSLENAITVLGLMLEHDVPTDMNTIAERTGIPVSTVYRYVGALRSAGVIFRKRRGEYCPSPAFVRIFEAFGANTIIAESARPHLERLSQNLGTTVHFGVLEDDMVTYIVKADTVGVPIFTREDEQLEAYCSGIGRVLLAALPPAVLDDYLAAGEFPALTKNTLTLPADIRKAIEQARQVGYGIDNAEVEEDLYCLAVPVADGQGRTIGAVSASFRLRNPVFENQGHTLDRLCSAARDISSEFVR